jgi:hypothetical protein
MHTSPLCVTRAAFVRCAASAGQLLSRAHIEIIEAESSGTIREEHQRLTVPRERRRAIVRNRVDGGARALVDSQLGTLVEIVLVDVHGPRPGKNVSGNRSGTVGGLELWVSTRSSVQFAQDYSWASSSSSSS